MKKLQEEGQSICAHIYEAVENQIKREKRFKQFKSYCSENHQKRGPNQTYCFKTTGKGGRQETTKRVGLSRTY